jgi:DNA-binding protein HU-beta
VKKNDFIALVKEIGNYETKVEAEKAVKTAFEAIEQVLKSGDEIMIPRFATFKTALLKGKEGTVPGTTKTYKTEDRMIPKFSPSQHLKEVVAGN